MAGGENGGSTVVWPATAKQKTELNGIRSVDLKACDCAAEFRQTLSGRPNRKPPPAASVMS
jgi:hypothetical protein